MKEEYFTRLNQMLKGYKRAIPCLLIDLDRLDQNLDTLNASLQPGMEFRVVVKSLPSPELISYVMNKMQTQRLMVFHQPFLSDLSTKLDSEADILLGKPMPVKTAAYYYANLETSALSFDPYRQIQWLVDTWQRIQEYIALAQSLGQKLRLNLEIDIGLHRGGFRNRNALSAALRLIRNHTSNVEFSGLMGYDPHVVKLPKLVRSAKKAAFLANSLYEDCKSLIRTEFPDLWREDLTFNGAGSPTIDIHGQVESPLNDVSAGSCLVKPSDFDIPTLMPYLPACFIAAPILKKLTGTTLPALESWKRILSLLNPRYRHSYFIYGGYWKADYCYPPGTRENPLFGSSTNQSMVNSPGPPILDVDDFVFLRPRQSEFVFLQFGNILGFRNGEILEEWGLLENE